jgi:hypothetical protein
MLYLPWLKLPNYRHWILRLKPNFNRYTQTLEVNLHLLVERFIVRLQDFLQFGLTCVLYEDIDRIIEGILKNVLYRWWFVS